MGRKCTAKNCNNLAVNTKMHRLPKEPERFALWISTLKCEIDYTKRDKYRVCDIHFSDNMRFKDYHNRTNLKADAVPDLNIPGK